MALANRALATSGARDRVAAVAANQKPKAPAGRQCAIFDNVDKIVEQLKSNIQESQWRDKGGYFSKEEAEKPTLLNFSLNVVNDDDYNNFMDKFKGSKLYDAKTASGRGSEMIMGDAKARAPACPMQIDSVKVRLHLTGADINYIDTCWHWASSIEAKAAGPEFCFSIP